MFLASTTVTNLNLASSFIVSFITFVVPMIAVAFAGMTAERSGIINLALEGMMIFGAFAGFAVLQAFNTAGGECTINPVLAVLIASLAAVAVGILVSFLLSFASIRLKANQTIIGTAINTLAPALTILLCTTIYSTSSINNPTWVNMTVDQIQTLTVPTTETVPELIAYFFKKIAFTNNYLTTWLLIAFVILVGIFLFKTRTGLRMRACGENPQAADSVGINVSGMRYLGTGISGALAGLGGFAICLAIGGFQGSVIGLGFLSLAIMIFGNWKPWPIVGAACVFAFFRVLAYSSFLPEIPGLNTYSLVYMCIPYLLTILVLIFASKRSHAPKAEGIPYDKGAR